MKKRTAIFFVLLANIILLAHAILPLHHCHQNIVCTENSDCSENTTNHTQNPDNHNHHNHGSDNATCILKQAVIVLPAQVRFFDNCENCTEIQHHFFFITTAFDYHHLLPPSSAQRGEPYFTSFYASFVAPSLGLRAPPTLDI